MYFSWINNLFLTFIHIGSLTTKDVHDFAIHFMSMQAYGTTRFQFTKHDFHLVVGKLFHDVTPLSPLKIGHDSFLDFIKVNLHIIPYFVIGTKIIKKSKDPPFFYKKVDLS